MITEQDLQEAIAECLGQRNPNASTCLKLAAFYTIKNEMFGKKSEPTPAYSYSGPVAEATVDYDGDSEFAGLIDGKNAYNMWSIMDELMNTLSVVEPKLYQAVLRKLKA